MNNVPAVKEFFFQNHPLHVFEYDGKIAFIAQEVGHILDINDVQRSIRRSKHLEIGVDYDVVPSDLIPKADQMSVLNHKRVTILYLSGFFTFVLRSNSELATPFNRWATREAIPEAFARRQHTPKLELSEKGLLKVLEIETKGSLFAEQILRDQGYKPAPEQNKQLTFDGGDDGE